MSGLIAIFHLSIAEQFRPKGLSGKRIRGCPPKNRDRPGILAGMIPDATRRFLSAAAALGLEVEPSVHPEGTKTAADAAAAVGCDVSAIVKTLVFIADDEPVLVLMSGDRMVDIGKLADLRDASDVRRAGLDEVRTHTGYAAGGTPPVGHTTPMDVYADESLRRNDRIWASAGTPTTVFAVDREVLVSATKAVWANVARQEPAT